MNSCDSTNNTHQYLQLEDFEDTFEFNCLYQQGWEMTVYMLCSRFGKAKVRKDFNYILEGIRISDNRLYTSWKLIWPKCEFWMHMVYKAYTLGILHKHNPGTNMKRN